MKVIRSSRTIKEKKHKTKKTTRRLIRSGCWVSAGGYGLASASLVLSVQQKALPGIRHTVQKWGGS